MTNTAFLTSELDWINACIKLRCSQSDGILPSPPSTIPDYLQIFFDENDVKTSSSRILLGLGLAKEYRPEIFIPILEKLNDRVFFAKIGGVISERSLQFYPTLRTAYYIVAGENLEDYIPIQAELSSKHRLFTSNTVILDSITTNNSPSIADQQFHLAEFVSQIYLGADYKSEYYIGAKPLTASSFHNHVILTNETVEQLDHFMRYLKVREGLKDTSHTLIKQNYIVVFSGEPGTGKTLSAKLIGSIFGYSVKVVNISRVVSKYVGETEKNLDKLFHEAENSNSILFFDEADALFSKRTEVKGANDKYANQETAFLLQKVEEFDGPIILATNLHDFTHAFDKAFHRRIRKVVKFEFPDQEQREKLWRLMLPDTFEIEEQLINHLAYSYQLTGANINNVVSNLYIDFLNEPGLKLNEEIFTAQIKEELKRCGKVFKVVPDDMVPSFPQSRLGWNTERGSF